MDSDYEEESDEDISDCASESNDKTVDIMCAELKYILLNPQLYLANHFADLRNEVDLAYESFMNTGKQLREDPISTERYTVIIKRIDCFEKECLENLSKEEVINFENINEVINLAEDKMRDTLWIEIYATKNELDDLSETVYKCLVDTKRNLFCNSTMIFWANQDIKKCRIDSFGKLLIVSDEYIGDRAFRDFKKLWHYANAEIVIDKKMDRMLYDELDYIERNYNFDIYHMSNDHLKLLYLISYLRRECKESFIESPITDSHLALANKRTFSLDKLCFVKAGRDLFDENLKNIEKLDLSSSGIHGKFGCDVFQKLKSLKSLNLADNNLDELPKGIFCGLKYLTRLDLADNQIKYIPNGCFNELNNLEDINLSNNKILQLPTAIFSKLELLKVISLKQNQLTNLPNDIFNKLFFLEQLVLSNNKIKNLQASCFKDLRSLKLLHLDCNEISILPRGVFVNIIKIEEINLSYNYLKQIPNDLFDNLTFLKTVKLHCDEIKENDGYTFVSICSSSLKIPGWIDFERTSTGKFCNSLKHVCIKKITVADVLLNH